MMKSLFVAAAITVVGVSQLSAQDIALPDINANLKAELEADGMPEVILGAPDGLMEFVSAIETDLMQDFHFHDLDGDGEAEAFITHSSPCNEIGCLFTVVDFAPGTRAEFKATQSFGRNAQPDTETGLIEASGVFWHWDGIELRPWGNALDNATPRSARPQELRTVYRMHEWRGHIQTADAIVYEIDLIGDRSPEKVLLLTNDKYLEDGDTPYYIFSSKGEIVDHSLAKGRPSIFPLADRDAVQIVQMSAGKLQLRIIE